MLLYRQFSYHPRRAVNHRRQRRCKFNPRRWGHRECPLLKGRVRKRSATRSKGPLPCRMRSIVLFCSRTCQDIFGRQQHPQFLISRTITCNRKLNHKSSTARIRFQGLEAFMRWVLVSFHALEHLLKRMRAKVDPALERTMDVGYRYEGKAEEQRERKDL